MTDALGFGVTKAIAFRDAHLINNGYYNINNRHTYIIMYYLRNIAPIYYIILYRDLRSVPYYIILYCTHILKYNYYTIGVL